MKSKRKPDLMLILTLFVLIGVVVSTVSSNDKTVGPTQNEEQDATVHIRTQNNDSPGSDQGRLLRVSTHAESARLFQ